MIREWLPRRRFSLFGQGGGVGVAFGLTVLLATAACSAQTGVVSPTHTVTATQTVTAQVIPKTGGRVEGPNGVAITVPPDAMEQAANVSITEQGNDLYDIHIAGDWRGEVEVEMPLILGEALIAHKVDSEWRFENATKIGGKAVARVDSLSTFSTMAKCMRKIIPPKPGGALSALKCFAAAGVKKLPEWIGKKIIGVFSEYDACKPMSPTNWSIDAIEIVLSSCQLSDPTVPVPPATRPSTTPPATPQSRTDPPAPPPASPSSLTVAFVENPFLCDGTLHALGTLVGARPGERITFTSAQVGGLLPGTANSAGKLPLTWQCGAGEAGSIWTVLASGSSGGSTQFVVTGKAPQAPPPPPAVRGFFIEDSYLGGTWARRDPWNGTWYSSGNRPANAAYWFNNGLGVGVDCTLRAAPYAVSFLDGRRETWVWWAHVTDNTWVPVATLREVSADGGQGLRTC